jgi:FlaA1/EpsC-like NDP-sugar epimerase
MQAGALGGGGEIFILDMGQPVRILDLAEDMIRLSGLQPYEDIDIAFSGIRQGEKLFEELELTGENLVKTRHPKIFIGKIGTYPPEKVENIVGTFRKIIRENDEAELRHMFNEFIPEAQIETKTQEVLRVAKDNPPQGTQEASTQSA